MIARLMIRPAAAALLVLSLPLTTPSAAKTVAVQRLDVDTIAIRSGKAVHNFKVEMARTGQQQAMGLMYRRNLPRKTGMLFPFSPPRGASFWMKNTYIPLDLLFIRADGTVAQISADAVPQSLDLIECAEPVAAVLEIGGGEAKRLGIKEGDTVTGAGFGG